MTLLREVQATMGPGRPRHFAILPLSDPGHELQYRRLLERKYGISPCFYIVVQRTRPDGSVWNDYVGLDILLQRLQADVAKDPAAAVPALASMPTSPKSAAKVVDSHNGNFGGLAQTQGRQLSATIAAAADRTGWFSVTLRVESTDAARPLAGQVVFYLHPSFRRPERSGAVTNGKATLRILSYGAFTAGPRPMTVLRGWSPTWPSIRKLR